MKTDKSLVLRKTELLAEQYDSWYWKLVLLFSAFLCGYGYGLDAKLRSVYTTYATNSYKMHSLLSTVGVINLVIGAISQIVYARLSDVFGRLTLFMTAIVFYAVGTIIQSQAYDVQRYAAGAVFYKIGYFGVFLLLMVILADFSSLKWRLFYTFVPTWPFIINTWISGNITDAADPLNNWSWDIAMWSFIFPLSCLPIICCMLHMRFRARKTDEWKELSSQKSFYRTHGFVQTMVQLFWKLDIPGISLVSLIFTGILVPLTLAGGVSAKWNNPRLIAPFVLGFALIPFFVLWESKYARDPVVPFKLLADRGVWAALSISFLAYFVYQMAAGYLYTILLVAINVSVKSATRITSINVFTSNILSFFFGLLVTRVKRLKPFIVFGAFLYMLATGLLYRFRSGEESYSGIVGAMVVWGIGNTMMSYPVVVSLQSITSHENMATVIALFYAVYRIGGAVGSAVSGAIWTQILYKKLLENLGDPALAASAYGSPLAFIQLHPWGSPTRIAMVDAYRYVQKYEILIGLIFATPLIVFALFLRDPPLTDKQAQTDLKDGEIVETIHEDMIAKWLHKRFISAKNKLRGRCV